MRPINQSENCAAHPASSGFDDVCPPKTHCCHQALHKIGTALQLARDRRLEHFIYIT